MESKIVTSKKKFTAYFYGGIKKEAEEIYQSYPEWFYLNNYGELIMYFNKHENAKRKPLEITLRIKENSWLIKNDDDGFIQMTNEQFKIEMQEENRAEKLESALQEVLKAMANSAYKAEILFLQTGIVGFSEIEIALKAEIAKAEEVLCE